MRLDLGVPLPSNYPAIPPPMRPAAASFLLLLSACGIPIQEDDIQREARFRTIAVCVAYHDLRGRGVQADTTDTETREAHRQAMEVCDQVEQEGGDGVGLTPPPGM